MWSKHLYARCAGKRRNIAIVAIAAAYRTCRGKASLSKYGRQSAGFAAELHVFAQDLQ